MAKSVFIIAEAGVNHNGSKKMAFQLIDAAIEAGADAIKFQTYITENLVTRQAVKANYQQLTTDENESQFDMLKKLELTSEMHYELKGYCKENNIQFLSSAFDLESLEFLSSKLGLKRLKISSGEITNGPLLLAYAQTGCELILSTGMSTLNEIEQALEVLAFGYLNDINSSLLPSKAEFKKAFLSQIGQRILKEKVIVLHCTTEYPVMPQEVNLNAMQTIREAFDVEVGYSDHSEGIVIPVAAVAMGATLIEKHLTLSKDLVGPDHKASLEPDEMTDMVNAIRIVEQSFGSGIKKPMISELKNRLTARKSLIAACEIKPGVIFSDENITAKRPGTGVSPMEYWEILGRSAFTSYDKDEVIKE